MVGAFRRGGETSLSVVPALAARLHAATGSSLAYATLHSLLERVRAAAAADGCVLLSCDGPGPMMVESVSASPPTCFATTEFAPLPSALAFAIPPVQLRCTFGLGTSTAGEGTLYVREDATRGVPSAPAARC